MKYNKCVPGSTDWTPIPHSFSPTGTWPPFDDWSNPSVQDGINQGAEHLRSELENELTPP